MFVLDASVALAWCFNDENSPVARRVLDALTEDRAMVPTLWTWEVTNALLMAERRKRLTGSEAEDVLRMLGTLPIETDETPSAAVIFETLRIARTQGITVYDASYLELALRNSLPLATLERRLGSSAKSLGVASV